MAVYAENSETWAICDVCNLTMFAGFNSSAEEVKSLSRFGWTFGKRVLCPYCSQETGQTPERR